MRKKILTWLMAVTLLWYSAMSAALAIEMPETEIFTANKNLVAQNATPFRGGSTRPPNPPPPPPTRPPTSQPPPTSPPPPPNRRPPVTVPEAISLISDLTGIPSDIVSIFCSFNNCIQLGTDLVNGDISPDELRDMILSSV